MQLLASQWPKGEEDSLWLLNRCARASSRQSLSSSGHLPATQSKEGELEAETETETEAEVGRAND